MNREDLYKSISGIDNDIIERSEKEVKKSSKRPWIKKWCAVAACVVIIAVGMVWGVISSNRNVSDSTDDPATGDSAFQDLKTSDTYSSLSDLLEYLSDNDNHSESAGDGSGRGTSDAESGDTSYSLIDSKNAAVYNGFLYHIGEEKVYISKLNGGNTENVGSIGFSADYMFIYGERLVLTGSYVSGGNELDEEMSAKVLVYDLSDPESPVLIDEYVQLGDVCACYLEGENLYLLTSDGVCACGWSRLDDLSEYVPKLSHNGGAIEWGEDDISILGEPTSVNYTAAVKINTISGKIEDKQAFYGDVKDVFYGSGWLALNVSGEMAEYMTMPEIYTFDCTDSFEYTGRISAADIFSIGEKVELTDNMRPDGTYPWIISLSRENDIYRILGGVSVKNGEKKTNSLLAVAADMKKGESVYETLDISDKEFFSYDEIIWEKNRAIISGGEMSGLYTDALEEFNSFVFAEFSDMYISFYQNDLTADHVAGIDMIYWMGNPFGELNAFIPMGNGIYLRYNGKPDGLDIYDFSDSKNPRCIYKTAGDIPDYCRFEFTWHVYDENTFGILMVSPDENGEYINGVYTWRIYSIDVDAKSPYTLLCEYDAQSGAGVETFKYNGEYYLVTRNSKTATLLG